MKAMQIRFFGDNQSYAHGNSLDRNYPSCLTLEDLLKGNIFLKYPTICSLTISALPGTKFILNGRLPSVVGQSGVYKVDNLNEKFTLTFERDTLENINTNPDGYIIIDLIYREE